MFGDVFKNIFKFIRVLYSFWTTMMIFRVKFLILWNLGETYWKKMENDKYCFGKKPQKLSHGIKFGLYRNHSFEMVEEYLSRVKEIH